MKIHSKFQDYYDSALAFGVDDHINWVRNVTQREIVTKTAGYYSDQRPPNMYKFFGTDMYNQTPKIIKSYRNPLSIRFVFAGVCGKVYPAVELSWADSNLDIFKPQYRYAYSVEYIVKYLKEFDKHKRTKDSEFKKFTGKKNKVNKNAWRYDGNQYQWNISDMEKYFKEHYASDKYMDIFISENVPLFVIDPNGGEYGNGMLLANPEMKKYGFQQVFDPYTMYQEIEMFLSGVLGTGNPDMVEIEDKHRIAGHGFTKCSFRKAPTKRKGECQMKGKK